MERTTIKVKEMIEVEKKIKLFEVGDIVTLRSGGPLMTVRETAVYNAPIPCAWFADGTPAVQVGSFTPHILKLVTDR
jgi:uncharacterized protein YodC (DUF2158 family)